MHCSANADYCSLRVRLLRWLFACSLALITSEYALSAPIFGEEGFRVRNADVRLERGIYLLDAKIVFAFSDEAIEAMENGVTLTVLVDVEVFRQRPLWDKKIFNRQLQFHVGVHALSKRYVIKNLDSGETDTYRSVEEMAAALGVIQGVLLFASSDLEVAKEYVARVRARLDIEGLPSPLRPLAYVSQAWRLASDWYELPLVR